MLIKLCLFLILLISQSAAGQSRYNFFTIGLEQGLSSQNVWSINQDKFGFIWIATVNGLNRYDGHTIKQYFNKPGDSTTIAGNSIYWVFKDSDGDVWFACGSGGLSKYNYTRDNFEHLVAYDTIRKYNRYNAPVWRVGEDAQKRLYLSSGAAMYRYTKKTDKFEDITYLFGKGWDAGIGNFVMDGKSTMWMPTDDGFFKYDLTADTLRKIPFDVEKLGFGSAGMLDAQLLNDAEILVSLSRGAYVIFNKKTEKFRPPADVLNPAKSGRYTDGGDIMKDSRGSYWMASSILGLMQYFPKQDRLNPMKQEPLYPYPYPEQEGSGRSIFEDRDGNIWYGSSNKGVIRFQPDFDFIRLYNRDYSVANSLPGDQVNSFAAVDKTTVFIATANGLCLFNSETNTYQTYPSTIKPNTNLPGSYVGGLQYAGDTLFMFDNLGVHFYKQKTKLFGAYKLDTAFYKYGVHTILLAGSDELLVVNNRIGSINLKDGKFYDKQNAPDNPLYGIKKVWLVAKDSRRNTIWIQAEKGKLYAYDKTTKKLAEHFYSNPADTTKQPFYTAMKTDEAGNVWVATYTGITRYDPQLHKSEYIVLPTGPGLVNNLATGGGWVWFTTANSVGRLHAQTKQIETFPLHTLLPNSRVIVRSLLQDSNGKIWIGTDHGFCLLDAKQFRSNSRKYNPGLVNFKIFDQPKYFDVPYSDVQRIDLQYQENFFSLDFTSFNYQNTTGIKYAYKLEGFDKDWNTTTEHTASYTNVPPGNYRFLLRSSNSAYGWDEMKKPLLIHIGPPFWRMWPFVVLCVLCLAGISFLWYLSRRKTYLKKSIEKSIDYFANSVYGNNSVTEICWDIARNCISQLNFEDCVVYLYDAEKKVMVQEAAYGPKNPRAHEIIHKIEIQPGQGIVGTVAASGKPLLIPDTTKDDRYIVDDAQRYSELAVPILHEGKVIGVIDSEHPKKHFFTAQHLKALSTIASISANKIAEARAEAAAQDQAIQLLEIKKLFAESQLMALRAQMNPHFVFNCLNSIQECIVTQKYGEASNYLNKFSKLFRSVLNNSGKTLVTLQAEKEVLELYLQLEHMRFEGSFSFKITTDEELDMNDLLVPSMLLQPYVENALWHGLMHKEGERKLLIHFKYISDDIFQCMIDDNGIGRKRSAELKAHTSKAKRHESKGMGISKDRIELLQRQGQHASLQIVDKQDEDGNATGTTVVVELSAFLE